MNVTVAIPVLNGAATLGELLGAVTAQEVAVDVELLVCDSGSSDDSLAIAAHHGARVLRVGPDGFSHGGTRNLLAAEAGGTHVAFLTQDAVPASRAWLAELLRGFTLAPDVALSFGPYAPRPGASLPVRRELDCWFRSFAPDGRPRVDRLKPEERTLAPRDLLGPRAYFTDANGCVAKAAWRAVRFRETPYAEDHQLALDMLFAGFAKAYMPHAAVVHSHDYGPRDELRRAFDEGRGLREVYAYRAPATLAGFRQHVVGPTRADGRLLRHERAGATRLFAELAKSGLHHGARYAGALLGGHADRLSPEARRRLSLERRDTFVPAEATQRSHDD